MTEIEFIEARIKYWKDLRNRFLKLYQELDEVVDEEALSKVGDIISTTEQRITELCKQLPPQDEVEKLLNEANEILNSDEKHLYLTELEEAERKLDRARHIINQRVVDKAHEEALNEAFHQDLWVRFDKQKEEALCEAADKTLQEYADIAAGRIFNDEDNVAHVNGTIETPRMVIEAAPRRTGRMFKSWLCNYFK